MNQVSECLNRRYKALDELVKELGSASDVDLNNDKTGTCCNDPGVRLMCDFWNILKENPNYNLKKAVQSRLDVTPKRSLFQPHKVSCYMAAHNCTKKDEGTNKSEAKPINECCHRGEDPKVKSKCCASKSVSSRQESSDALPLTKVLCNLKEAASFDRKCQGMVNDLMAAQKELQDQIQHLEHREKEGVQLLKQADCMWSCMENAYKKKILESQERQQGLIKQLKDAEANTNKWRKNKKDLEFQMENVNTCQQEIVDKLNQKQNDIKCMNRDIADYNKKIENNKKELEAAKKSMVTKKRFSDDKIKKMSEEINKKEAIIKDEKAHKQEKENEGNQYIKEARADLLNLSRVLLQKKIENEEIKTQIETLIDELEILSQTYDQCKDRCKFKKQSIENEIIKIDNEIANHKSKCIRCHQCTDTIDMRKCCTDCPRCLEERECLLKDDHCSPDHTMDCVCMSVKQKFLDNVFENMYTVLERQIKTGPGKCVAETVINCLKRSRNGKLDQETRQILQDFILTTVKKNLNLTIVGGAVKTRCELDPETYKQLMLCLKQVKAVRPPKADKQTAAKKPPCPRWGGESECNCPKEPKGCICTKHAPAPPNEPGPCPTQDPEDKGEEKICPHKESSACGPDCAMHAVPSAVGADVAAWRPDPCQGPTCMFKNMRAAQCVLGPEALNTVYDAGSFVTAVPHVPNTTVMKDQCVCKSGSSPTTHSICKDTKQMKVDTRTQCDEDVCGLLRCNLHGEESLSHIAKPHKNNLAIDSNDSNQSPNKTTNNESNNLEKVIVDSKIKADLIKQQFQPLLSTKSIQNGKSFFDSHSKELKNNASKSPESSKMEIDEKIIEMIENITNKDPSSFVSLKKTKSGHLILGFNSVSDDGQTVVVRRSPSGNMVIEIDKNAIHSLAPETCKKELCPDKTEASGIDRKIFNRRCNKMKNKTHNSIKNKPLGIFKEDVSLSKLNEQIISKEFLKNMYEKGRRNIEIRFKRQNKNPINMQGTLTKMSSRTIAIHVNDANILNNDEVELPVSLQRTISGTFNVGFDDIGSCNGIARRTASNGFLVYINKINIQELKPFQPDLKKTDVFKIKIKGLDNVIKEPPAVIRRTSSGNFEVVLEKEFEKYFTKTIQHQMVDEKESFCDLIRTSSGVILDFDTVNNVNSHSQKALIMKSKCGLLKIIISDVTRNKNEETNNTKKSLTFGSIMSAKVLGELLGKLPSNSQMHINYNNTNKNKLQTNNTKSSSDSHLYKTAKIKLHSNQSLLENSSTTLKKTPSGKYAVVLNKESKKSFILNLLSYLDKSSKGVIPIKRTDSGEIIINCDKNSKIGECESLKITHSGNIYLILDKNIVEQLYNNAAISTSSISNKTDISPYISKIENLENKAIATNCNAYLDDSLCDSSKCVCERLSNKRDTIRNSNIDTQNMSLNFCGKCECSGLRDKQSINSNNKTPHIIIRPYESRPDTDKRNKFQESYYCELQSVCPYHKDRYEDVSNELLEIRVTSCNKAQEKSLSKDKTYTELKQFMHKNTANKYWDSLEYLPHQLPPFLRNIKS